MTGIQAKSFPIAMTAMFLMVSAISISGLHASPKPEAQPISCAQADDPSDYAICNSETLLLLDEELTETARERFANLETEVERSDFREEQAEWADGRGACGNNAECIEAHYRARLREIGEVESASISSFKRFALQTDTSGNRID